ncbi:AraC family transcriptional regulator [Pasteurellaceae bacterium LFhippo2]|nr:AraC family transcriptional regulator [Pasteurellaceae bacterium LFhippo2]
MLSNKGLQRLLQVIPHNELYTSAIKGLFIRHSDTPFQYESVIQEPSICVVLRGERTIQLGEQCYQFDHRHFMFCPVNIPTRGEIKQATKEDPFLVVSMKIDLSMVSKILLEQQILPSGEQQNSQSFGQWSLNEELENAFTRLLLLHENPKDIAFLAPLIQQEIYYRLLTGEQGEKLKQMVSFGSHTQKIAKATDYLREHFAETVTVETLADLCGMSLSGFHSHFKKITTMSPLQYQKSLRLMESKRLISQEKMPIANVAFQVGYESPSQFSREYKRYFGVSPSGDLN